MFNVLFTYLNTFKNDLAYRYLDNRGPTVADWIYDIIRSITKYKAQASKQR